MKSDRLRIPVVLLTLVLLALACEFNVSTAKISSATLTADPDNVTPTTVFSPDQNFYCVVELANAPSETTVKGVWTAVEAEGVDPNFVIDEAEVSTDEDEDIVTLSLQSDNLWPAGKYKVDLYLNDKLDRTLEFQVQ